MDRYEHRISAFCLCQFATTQQLLLESPLFNSSRYLYELDFGHELAQIYFFDFWQWDSMLIPPRGVRSQSRGGKLDFLAKVATKNSQNRHLAEFCHAY